MENINTGWYCPRCNHINAPWKSQCDCLGLPTFVPYYPPVSPYKIPSTSDPMPSIPVIWCGVSGGSVNSINIV